MNTEIRQRAKALAEKIQVNLNKDLESSRDQVTEELCNLFNDRQFEPIQYHSMIVSLMALLTNPDVSSKLDKYSQENAGSMLSNLLGFFDTMSYMGLFFDHTTLSRYCGCMDEKTLKVYEERYSDKLKSVAA